jgi:prepilin-type processing-associated H-X9-DG protein
VLATQDIGSDAFVCPATNTRPALPAGSAQQQAAVLHQHCSYVYVPGGNFNGSAERVIAYEPLANHGGDGANFLYGDGRASWEPKARAAAIIKSLEADQNPPP